MKDDIVISSFPPQVGYWLFPGSSPGAEIRFILSKKPNLINRITMKLLLGFEWVDDKKEKNETV